MSGTQSLIQAFESGVLTQPRHDLPNLVDLARAIAKLSGVCDLDLSPSAAEIAAKIGDPDHLVLMMADGVGMNLVESMPRSSFLPKRLHDELLTVFPSTTSVALTSLTTGEWPVRHAITGWWTHLPDLGSSATILQYTARNGGRDLRERGIDPQRSFPVSSIWSSIPADTQIFVPKSIAGSVYSRYFSGGRATVGYTSLREGIDRAIRRIQGADEKTFTYFYTPRVDTLAHRHGVSRPEVRHALVEVDNESRRHRRSRLPGRSAAQSSHAASFAKPAAPSALPSVRRRPRHVPAHLGLGQRSGAPVLRASLRRTLHRYRRGRRPGNGPIRPRSSLRRGERATGRPDRDLRRRRHT